MTLDHIYSCERINIRCARIQHIPFIPSLRASLTVITTPPTRRCTPQQQASHSSSARGCTAFQNHQRQGYVSSLATSHVLSVNLFSKIEGAQGLNTRTMSPLSVKIHLPLRDPLDFPLSDPFPLLGYGRCERSPFPLAVSLPPASPKWLWDPELPAYWPPSRA